ncbi:nitrite reductase large subunit NirB [Crenobacter cavernae]|uniref:NAD(P)/FAD-dependent oxidoreductase n=1 Tax=Crenobacter cavernae TaxID=2290923 RepID=A0A345Y2M5_9NEIS|nr:nitrite reductase large subunit NirB [Crenobacter cavernae]AXK38177.1 NAD(P)/FAD-dependent oxidoreductase [Crenobacter cavernae]
MDRKKLVLVGNGMAGIRALEELFALAPDAYDVTVFGAEPHPNYNRILLSPVLAGEQDFCDIVLNDLAWYEEHNIRLYLNSKVEHIDRENKVVRAEDGTEVPYDVAILATGSQPFILPVPGRDLDGVLAYRDIADTQAMMDAAATGGDAVVIGGGLLGLEAANGLMKRGMRVTVVHLGKWLLERQLDETAGKLLEASLASRGMDFCLNAQTEALLDDGAGRVAGVRLADGRVLPAKLVVMAVGIRPDAKLAEAAGLDCNRGVVVDDTLRTSDPSIYALGECANHRGIAYGLVAPLYEMAKVLAQHLAGTSEAAYQGSLLSTKLKVTGIELFSAGDFMGGDDCEDIVLSDPAAGLYKRLVIKGDKLVGACLYGDSADGGWYFKLMRESRELAETRDRLMFGEAFHLGDKAGADRTAAMADADEVCGCNGVCKGTIVKAITEQGLMSVDAVKKHTKAASSCGSCTGLVEQILLNTLGSDFQESPKTKVICGCTEHTHGEVRAAIREKHLTTIPDVMRALNWRTPNGCASCRPALNYYLVSTWPREAIDDPQSRFVNERVHANIQKDGTYSVIPQMMGGVTNAAELRRIADVADKYQVPMVKVTGGQRIDLLGIKKDDLVDVWRDLGMKSGYAYGKSIRTVKTCVGSEFCRFGTQNSTQMGIDLETMLGRMWSPHKVKLAVSGCPRNCAESGIKDVGIIGVDSGWELYVGGNGGIKTEVAQFFVKVKTADEVREYAGAFLQLYREEAYYLERTVHYLARVGLEHAKAKVLDDAENRKALYERLLFSLEGLPDPWEERVQGAQQHEYKTLEVV